MKSHNRGVGNPNAAPTTFGFEFQVVVGILLSLEYVDRLEYVAIEGKDQDIEIKLKNNDMVYCQAKSTSKLPSQSGFNSGWTKQLGNGINSLFRDYLGMKNKGLLIKKFIYAVNYFYPLGKNKGNDKGFRSQKSIETYGNGFYGDELYKSQIQTLIEHLENFNTDSKGNIAPEIKQNISTFRDRFLSKLEIIIYNFIRYRDPRTRYANLISNVKAFLSDNYLDIGIDPRQLARFWKYEFYFNSTTDGKVHIARQQFLMSIYAINILEETQYQALGIHDPDPHKEKVVIDNYQDFIVSNQNSTRFIGMMRKDLIQFCNVKSSKDLMNVDFEDNRKKRLFIKQYGGDFEPLFNIIGIRHSNVTAKFMTKYAIMDWLNKLSLLSHLLEGKLKSVH